MDQGSFTRTLYENEKSFISLLRSQSSIENRYVETIVVKRLKVVVGLEKFVIWTTKLVCNGFWNGLDDMLAKKTE